MTKKTLSIMTVTVCSKFFGFLRGAVLAAVFGATLQTDAFYMASSILTVLNNVISAVLASVIVPNRTQVICEEGKGEADKYTSSLLNLVIFLTLIGSLVSCLFAPQIVKVFAPMYFGEQFELTVLILRIIMPLMCIMACITTMMGILASHRRFLPEQLIGFVLNLSWMIVPLCLASRYGIYAMVCGYVVGTVAQVFFLMLPLRHVFRYQLTFNLRSPAMKRTLSMCLPSFLGTAILMVSQTVDKALASGLTEGNVSAMTYANQLVQTVTGIVVLPLSTVLFTSLSDLVASGDTTQINNLLSRSSIILMIVLAPITLYCMLFGGQIVSIVYQRGQFGIVAHQYTTLAFSFYAMSFLPFGLHMLLTRCFFAHMDTKTPLIITVVGVIINIILDFVLIGYMQIGGLALAYSISYFIQSIILIFLLRRKVGPLGLSLWFSSGVKIVIACCIMLIVVWVISTSATFPMIWNLMLYAMLGFASYIAVLWLLRQEEVRMGMRMIWVFIRRGKHLV